MSRQQKKLKEASNEKECVMCGFTDPDNSVGTTFAIKYSEDVCLGCSPYVTKSDGEISYGEIPPHVDNRGDEL